MKMKRLKDKRPESLLQIRSFRINIACTYRKSGVEQDVLKEFFETAGPLDYAIRGIIGMDADAVNERFLDFISAYPSLKSSQISFLNLLKNHISRYGSIEIEQLYEPPFTTLHSDGLDGVFDDENMVEKLLNIISTFQPKAYIPGERPYGIN
jgi:type I restriction enzyme R subunit